ncbi:MAG: gluconate:H+ symporter [Bacteroidia bacterium]|nr:gluconate:H+ symporter [Bacteroidia bacterium]
MLLALALGAIALLLILISVLRLSPFLAFMITAPAVGFAAGLAPQAVFSALETGIGKALGPVTAVLCIGAMLGKLIAGSGGAQRITEAMTRALGMQRLPWAMMITGFVVGIPLFYNVGFVILVPLLFTLQAATRQPLLPMGIPLLAALSVTHGYLPPHPAPVYIADVFQADLGLTLLYGFIVAVPAVLAGGPWFAQRLGRLQPRPDPALFQAEPLPSDQLPPLGASVLTALLPVVLIAMAALVQGMLPEGHLLRQAMSLLGNPAVALLISLLLGLLLLGIRRGRTLSSLMQEQGEAVKGISPVLIIIAGAGALKEMLDQAGVSQHLASLLDGSPLPPLVLGWAMAACIRVCIGSATIAGFTTAGILAPFVAASGASPELMVLAIGAGSLFLSHVNDTGFWMFKEYFGLSVRDTLRSWSVMETLVSVVGLAGVLLLDLAV